MALNHSEYWVPRREGDLIALQARWTETIGNTAKQTAYNWPAADCTAAVSTIATFTTAWNAYNGDKTPEKRIAKDECSKRLRRFELGSFRFAKTPCLCVEFRLRRNSEAIRGANCPDAMRDFANEHIRFNKAMSTDEKAFLGIEPHDTVPSQHPVPASVPDTDARNTENHFEHKVSALNAEGKASKPGDAYGVRFAWQVGGTAPTSGADLPKGRFSRKPVIVVSHGEEFKGQTAYYSTCYENSKGEAGGWSPVIEAIIA